MISHHCLTLVIKSSCFLFFSILHSSFLIISPALCTLYFLKKRKTSAYLTSPFLYYLFLSLVLAFKIFNKIWIWKLLISTIFDPYSSPSPALSVPLFGQSFMTRPVYLFKNAYRHRIFFQSNVFFDIKLLKILSVSTSSSPYLRSCCLCCSLFSQCLLVLGTKQVPQKMPNK